LAEPYLEATFAEPRLVTSCWYLYLIETVQGKLYTGITTDVERRFEQHKSGKGGAKFFRTDPPLRLRISLEFSDRSSASKAEYRIKQLTHKQKLALITRELVG
jgi:putative endonuclease